MSTPANFQLPRPKLGLVVPSPRASVPAPALTKCGRMFKEAGWNVVRTVQTTSSEMSTPQLPSASLPK